MCVCWCGGGNQERKCKCSVSNLIRPCDQYPPQMLTRDRELFALVSGSSFPAL